MENTSQNTKPASKASAELFKPRILNANVMHLRLLPKKNGFNYGVYYLSIPLSALENGELAEQLAVNRFAWQSFYACDHGYRDNHDIHSLRQWAEEILATHDIAPPKEIVLLTMPRICGYLFNPVSFWLCYDDNQQLTAVINEVNNTFGETHSYLCELPAEKPHHRHKKTSSQPSPWMKANKVFHVSPFLHRTGRYLFRYHLSDGDCRIDINYEEKDTEKTLLTAVTGEFSPLTKKNLRKAAIRTPLLTLKVIFLIHYQAAKILFKGIKYIKKPEQLQSNHSKND